MHDGRRVWNFFAPIYDLFMRQNKTAYEQMYKKIRKRIKDKRVLELCTGTGLIAKHVADSSKEMVASDFAEKMIKEAMKGDIPDNLFFQQADATQIPFENNSFDIIIISNALHIIPNPEKALSEIHRVLRPDGILIAPNFLGHRIGRKARFLTKILSLVGVVFEVTWDENGYAAFLEKNGWRIISSEVLKASYPLMYTECAEIDSHGEKD